MCFRWPDACPQFEKPKNQKIHENLTKNLIIPWLLCKVSLIERKGHSITLLTKWKQLWLCINLDIEEAEMDGWSFPLKSDPSSASVSSSAEAAFLSEKRTMYVQQCTVQARWHPPTRFPILNTFTQQQRRALLTALLRKPRLVLHRSFELHPQPHVGRAALARHPHHLGLAGCQAQCWRVKSGCEHLALIAGQRIPVDLQFLQMQMQYFRSSNTHFFNPKVCQPHDLIDFLATVIPSCHLTWQGLWLCVIL